MTKLKILLISGLVVFIVSAVGLYKMMIPLFHMKIFNPEGQQSFNKLWWLLILGGAAMITAGVLRLINEIMGGKRKK